MTGREPGRKAAQRTWNSQGLGPVFCLYRESVLEGFVREEADRESHRSMSRCGPPTASGRYFEGELLPGV
jgi:hypothetical protein